MAWLLSGWVDNVNWTVPNLLELTSFDGWYTFAVGNAVGVPRATPLLAAPIVLLVMFAPGGLSSLTLMNLRVMKFRKFGRLRDPYFGVLAAEMITNTGPSVINGDLGIHPNNGSSVTGFPPGLVNGITHFADAVALQAQSDTTTAYDELAGLPCDVVVGTADLTGDLVAEVLHVVADAAGAVGAEVGEVLAQLGAVDARRLREVLAGAGGGAGLRERGEGPQVDGQPGDRGLGDDPGRIGRTPCGHSSTFQPRPAVRRGATRSAPTATATFPT